jgi:hypothetical protein
VRRIYALTPAGSEALAGLVRDTLAQPPHDLRSDLALATVWVGPLPRDEVLVLLDSARAKLEKSRRERTIGREAKAHMSPLAEALFDNAEAILDADERLLRRLHELVASGQQ